MPGTIELAIFNEQELAKLNYLGEQVSIYRD